MRLLRRASRLVALVLGVVLASVSLTGGGRACTMSDDASMSMPSAMSMAMHGEPMTSAAASHASAGMPAPCHLPTAPNACVGMATCTSVALPSLAVAVTSVRVATERAVVRTAELAAGDARAPELPPPRA